MSHTPTRGLVLGKFLPPHAGHLRLVRFAAAMVDRVDVVVGTLTAEPIPGELRFDWMKELCPEATVHHLSDELPAYPHEHPDFWAIWKTSLLRCLGGPPTHVFASEDYGAELARVLGATFVPMTRPASEDDGPIAISGTALRDEPWKHWRHLPEVVRPHFLRRIHIVGPESVGKSTLAANLAREFDTLWVPEYARTWLTREEAPMAGGLAQVTLEDMAMIARGQRASALSLERSAHKRIFFDTDILSTTLWAEKLAGGVPPGAFDLAALERPDLTLLLDVDVPFVADSIRYLPEERQGFFEAFERLLRFSGRQYLVLRGGFEERFAAAVQAVHAIPPPTPLP